ncbi:response regulator [Spirosoma linguale]|uniref:Response regulator receiver protein n=1 Tax=Spirosoma linguale (strain ATCC 33905 / DSM 74 / LMG 10896 / Claus 1) TaxID=504472 RepID=D2QHF9_SPILD|nr:response regulator receiver protein [Spirosoma linguale DSM 74]
MDNVKQVIVIDDDDDDCLFLEQGLQKQTSNLVIYRFVSGDEFINSQLWQNEEHSYKLILLEFILPGEDGLDWLKLFLAHECCQNIPVVMYSSLAIEPQACKQAGAADYITKPCDLVELDLVSEKICLSWLLD